MEKFSELLVKISAMIIVASTAITCALVSGSVKGICTAALILISAALCSISFGMFRHSAKAFNGKSDLVALFIAEEFCCGIMGLSVLLLIMSVSIGILIDSSSVAAVGFAQCIILSLLWFTPYKEKLQIAVMCMDSIVAMDCSISLKGIFTGRNSLDYAE